MLTRLTMPARNFSSGTLVGRNSPSIAKLFADGKYRLLAGCAPCQPFSKLTNGIRSASLMGFLDNFGRFVEGIEPELVSMENVPELAQRGRPVFESFVSRLEHRGYSVDWKIVNCSDYGAPQSRKRLVLLASQLGPIAVPKGRYVEPNKWRTVRQTIGGLPPIATGKQHPHDPLHAAALLSPRNLQRIRATPHDGGTRRTGPTTSCSTATNAKAEHAIIPSTDACGGTSPRPR